MADNHGKFCWYELMTTDTEGAKAFYTKLIRWGTQPIPMPDMEYTMWLRPGSTDGVGGLSTLPAEAKAMGAPPHWLLHVAVKSVDDTAKLVTELGGKTFVPPTDIPGFGRFAVFADHSGAVFAAYTGADASVEVKEPNDTLGNVAWHELMTADVEAACAFYGRLFGWKKTSAMDMGPEMGPYQMFGLGEKSYGGMMKRPPNVPVSAWLPYFNVESVDQSVTAFEGLGAKLMHGPMEVPGGARVAVGIDPQGAAFAIHSTK